MKCNGCAKSFAAFFVLHIPQFRQTITCWFVFQNSTAFSKISVDNQKWTCMSYCYFPLKNCGKVLPIARLLPSDENHCIIWTNSSSRYRKLIYSTLPLFVSLHLKYFIIVLQLFLAILNSSHFSPNQLIFIPISGHVSVDVFAPLQPEAS
jgi:hypothetical protein